MHRFPIPTFASMFFKSRYLGLTGTKLNIAIGAIAGLDFLWALFHWPHGATANKNTSLFGYDQGVMGGLLDLPSFVTPPAKPLIKSESVS